MHTKQLENIINTLLNADQISDYCPNGLQVDGSKPIKTIVTGVTACQALIDQAIKLDADAILVHHGYFWKNEAQTITGIKYQRIKKLIENDIALLGYHLPLDVHPHLGNNAQLIDRFQLCHPQPFDTGTPTPLGLIATTTEKTSLSALCQTIENSLQRTPTVIEAHDRPVNKVAICSGGAQDFIEHAYHAGADVYISGEISERTTHIARELGIHYISAGHHATERYGIQALGEHLAKEYGLTHHFIDIDNPA